MAIQRIVYGSPVEALATAVPEAVVNRYETQGHSRFAEAFPRSLLWSGQCLYAPSPAYSRIGYVCEVEAQYKGNSAKRYRAVLSRRKPRPPSRSPGAPSVRRADRQFSASLPQLPPRTTRAEPAEGP
jgi:hypothetical protein